MVNDNQEILSILSQIFDPEIPVLSILDLGIVESISNFDNQISIGILPTYIGCPAMNLISSQIEFQLRVNGYRNIDVSILSKPVWTSNRITPKGLLALKNFGLAVPQGFDTENLISGSFKLPCPYCESSDTQILSPFGSTACKALFKCNSCKEPFEYFKCKA